MELAQRLRRLSDRPADRALYQWAAGAGLVVTLAYAGLAAATLRDTVDGVPVSAGDAAWPFWLGTAAVALLAGALAQIAIQLARPRLVPPTPADALPSVEDQRRGQLAWVLPALSAVAAVLLVRLAHTLLAAIAGGLAVLLATVAGIVAHYHLRDETPARRATAAAGLTVLTHGVALLLLTAIYTNKWRGLVSVPAITLATLLLLLQLTDGAAAAWLRRLLYAITGSLLIGQLTWPLNAWPAPGWTGGALLLVAFYLIAGLTIHHLRAALTPRVLVEYLSVAGLAFLIIAVAVALGR